MEFEWDDAKNRANRAKHGVAFEAVAGFDFDGARVVEDSRSDYRESRRVAFGEIAGRLYVLVYTWRDTTMRIISLRKANKREQRYYAEATD